MIESRKGEQVEREIPEKKEGERYKEGAKQEIARKEKK